MPIQDYETTCRLNGNGIRVWFTDDGASVQIVGLYYLDTDAEIDWSTLPVDDQINIEQACINELSKGY